MPESPVVPSRRRLIIALALGALAGWRCWATGYDPLDPPDFAQNWLAARALLAGHDPYAVVGPGLPFFFPFRLTYPLTAAVVALPVASFTLPVAATLFAFVASAAFGWALMANGYAPLLGMLSGSMLIASQEAQWSPALAAATVIPPLGILFAAKPTIGAAMFAARPSWWPFVGGAVILAVAFALDPSWLSGWRHVFTLHPPNPGAPAPYLIPVRLGAGPLVLLALVRWRRPEARLLAALACVPQTVGMYESVPLWLVPRTWKESALLLVLSHVLLSRLIGYSTLPDAYRLRSAGQAAILLMYLPCVLMVLGRPNEGKCLRGLTRA